MGFSRQESWSRVPLPCPYLNIVKTIYDKPGLDFPGGSDSKVFVYNVGDLGLIPGSVRSPGEENGNTLQYYCLENPMDRGAW